MVNKCILVFKLSPPNKRQFTSNPSQNIPDQVGKELVNEINQALEKYGVDLRAFALVINL